MKYMPIILILVAMTAGAQQYEREGRDGGDSRHDDGDDLQLVCFGEGEKATLENHSGYVWNATTHDGMIKFNGRCELDSVHRRL